MKISENAPCRQQFNVTARPNLTKKNSWWKAFKAK